MRLTDYTSYADAQAHFASEKLWELFDGDRERLNIAHECIDRHATNPDRVALRVAHADGGDEALTFRYIADQSSQFAHLLQAEGIEPGERVAIMLEPGETYYVALFGCMKAGCVAVPLFTAFGPDGLRLRIDDCTPKVLLTTADKASIASDIAGLSIWIADAALQQRINAFPAVFDVDTSANDMAVFQYTSGTTRALPDAIKHTHRAVVVVIVAALYGTGIRPADKYFCPSSPAWGHGLWHGTLAPLALGVETGAYAGKFDADRLMRALVDFGTTNLSAAATHYRMMMNAGSAGDYAFKFEKLSFTGEPMDSETAEFCELSFGFPVRSMYGTTEIGVILVNYPGAADFAVKPGSLGKPPPGVEVQVQRADGAPTAPGEIGEIMLRRRGKWFPTKDLGTIDEDGYFYHGGRADDVIISAGWTISAVEVEDALLKHPDVLEAACIGVRDPERGQVVKAFLVSKKSGEAFADEVRSLVRSRLSAHEYPRIIKTVDRLPKTPAGKVNRKVLREAEASRASE